MKKEIDSRKIKEAIKNREPIVVNYGKGYITQEEIKEVTFWNSEKNRYISETGQWSTDLLQDIAKGEVPNVSIELIEDE